LTFDRIGLWDPCFSPDGTKIITPALEDGGEYYDIWEIILDFDRDGILDYIDTDDDNDGHTDDEDAYPYDPDRWNGRKSEEEKRFFIPIFETHFVIGVMLIMALLLRRKRFLY
jgi:hypothetical protein